MKYLDSTGLSKVLQLIKSYVDDHSSGSSSGSSSDIYLSLPKTAQAHNSTYRGKDITSYVTSGEIKSMIQNGTYDDVFVGDYFTISGTYCTTFRIMHLDYFSNQFGDHIMAVVPDMCTYVYDSGTTYANNIKNLYNSINTQISSHASKSIRLAEIANSTQPTIYLPSANSYGIGQSSGSSIQLNVILAAVVHNPQLIYAGYSSSSQTYAYFQNENNGTPDNILLVNRYGKTTRNQNVTLINRIRPIIPITCAF